MNNNINTSTITTVHKPEEISIKTYYNSTTSDCSTTPTQLPDIQQADLAEYPGSLNGVDFIEGELPVVQENYPQNINEWVEFTGDMDVKSNDSGHYYIDNDGYLIYDFCDEP
jgi:hypothetical protein